MDKNIFKNVYLSLGPTPSKPNYSIIIMWHESPKRQPLLGNSSLDIFLPP
jgi:hypothetical protein